ncbi:MAG: pitrilysin family protein [Dehalococcoidia bacterium]|nr:pitrilysin family protein [Dehalococcoidia bacterium]
MYHRETLPSGLRILTSEMPYTRSISMAIFIGTGARYEQDEEAGLSHFLEHLLFKGTARRPTAQEISEAIEGVGGMLNGATDKELTVYSCKVAKPHFPLGLDVLVDMLRRPIMDPAELEKERRVVIEELHMIQDDPRDWVDVLIDRVMWPANPLGRDVAGSEETVNSFTREMALGYLTRQYAPRNTVVSIAGDFSHDEIVAQVSSALGDWRGGPPTPIIPAAPAHNGSRLELSERPTEQAHFCLAAPALSSRHPDRFILDLLNVVLGEGMSSRLFLEIREKRGLAYDVHSQVNHYVDAGASMVYAGVDPKRIEDAIKAVLEQLELFRAKRVPPEELTKAKEFTKGRLFLRMEDTRSVVGWMGAQDLLLDQILEVDEVVDIIEAVTAEDIQRVARDIFLPEKMSLAVVGPFKSDEAFAKLLNM